MTFEKLLLMPSPGSVTLSESWLDCVLKKTRQFSPTEIHIPQGLLQFFAFPFPVSP